MTPDEIDISVVVPTFNKSEGLRWFLSSLTAQTGGATTEYVFVDDCSTDATLEVLRRETAAWPNVLIVENAENKGPSVRLNQGAARARGRYLCLVDPDEVLAPDALAVMKGLLERHGADAVHGKWRRSGRPAAETVAAPIGTAPDHAVSETPLDTALGRGFVRMTWLVTRELFARAGGCDERIFVQDESLRLRLCFNARRLVDLREVITYVPSGGEHVSGNPDQLNHDRFFAFYNFLRDAGGLTGRQRRRLRRACVSAAWKSARTKPFSSGKLRIFLRYVASSLPGGLPGDSALEELAAWFGRLPGLRRPQP